MSESVILPVEAEQLDDESPVAPNQFAPAAETVASSPIVVSAMAATTTREPNLALCTQNLISQRLSDMFPRSAYNQ